MKKEYLYATIFFGVVAISFYLFYRLLEPFFTPLFWAAIFVIIFYPLYTKLEKYIKSANIRSIILTGIIVILIIGPVTYLGVALVQEAVGLLEQFKTWADQGKLDKLFNVTHSSFYLMLEKKLAPYVDLPKIDPKTIIENALKSISRIALSQATQIITNAGRVVMEFLLMIFFMFFLFRDGEALLQQIREVIPMSPGKKKITINYLKNIIKGTMYGGVVVALIQGTLGGIMFAALGLPAPIFWGALMAFLAFLPIVGTYLVYVPAGLIMLFTGNYVKGIILITIGTVVVSQIDNVLRPWVISGRSGMHTMLVFVSVMGGIGMFGLLGIVLGPFIAAVFVSMFNIFRLKLAEESVAVAGPSAELEANSPDEIAGKRTSADDGGDETKNNR
jgi:predicted PurR-regulated permease PerM